MNFTTSICYHCFVTNIKLCISTQSLIYHVECNDVYDIMKCDITRFDTSDYPTDHERFANKKVLGLMKDKNNGAIMTEFNHRIGLRAKMYAIKVDSKNELKRRKV